jgi:hypothetical protein
MIGQLERMWMARELYVVYGLRRGKWNTNGNRNLFAAHSFRADVQTPTSYVSFGNTPGIFTQQYTKRETVVWSVKFVATACRIWGFLHQFFQTASGVQSNYRPVVTGGSFQVCEDDFSSWATAKVKNVARYASTPPYVFMVWRGRRTDIFFLFTQYLADASVASRIVSVIVQPRMPLVNLYVVYLFLF